MPGTRVFDVRDSSMEPRIGYVVERFPKLSETFILSELLELERAETAVNVFALKQFIESVHHAALCQLRTPVIFLPTDSSVRKLPLRTECFATGAFAMQTLAKLSSTPADIVFPGKTISESKTLMVQSAALAAVSWASGMRHLHAHFATDATTVAMLASRINRVPYSFTAHAYDIFYTYTARAKDTAFLVEKIKGARFVVTVSDYNRRHLQNLVGPSDAAKIRRIYNGIDLNTFTPTDAEREPDLILGVGRLVEKKGFGDLIRACGSLAARKLPFRCMIVGEGPARHALMREACQLGLGDRISFSGAMPQEMLLKLMQRATVLAAPCKISARGDRDGLPTVLLEALATGLPAVSTDVAGIPEIIDSGVSGLLVPPGNVECLADELARILSDPQLQKRLALAGRSKAERDFNVRRNVAVLRDLLAESASGRLAEG